MEGKSDVFIGGVELLLDAGTLDLLRGLVRPSHAGLRASLSGVVVATTPQDVTKIAAAASACSRHCTSPSSRHHREHEHVHRPHCGSDTDVFRSGGGERMSGQPAFHPGAIPLDADIVTGGDEGRPMLLDKPDSVAAEVDRGDRHGTGGISSRVFRPW